MSEKFRFVFFRNSLSQELGLRFRKAAPNTLYIFDFNRSVQSLFSMWFVFSPIDVYFLDETKKVLDVKRSFKPFTTYKAKKRYWYVVETAQGLLKKRIGDLIQF